MSTDSRSDHFFIYPKFENKEYSGHTICVVLREGRMYHGEALCATTDQFNKFIGRKISYARAIAEYERDKECRESKK